MNLREAVRTSLQAKGFELPERFDPSAVEDTKTRIGAIAALTFSILEDGLSTWKAAPWLLDHAAQPIGRWLAHTEAVPSAIPITVLHVVRLLFTCEDLLQRLGIDSGPFIEALAKSEHPDAGPTLDVGARARALESAGLRMSAEKVYTEEEFVRAVALSEENGKRIMRLACVAALRGVAQTFSKECDGTKVPLTKHQIALMFESYAQAMEAGT